MQTQTSYCPYCGSHLAYDARFCSVCGNQAPVNPMQPPPAYPMQTAPYAMSLQEERNWAMFCHLASLIGWVFPFGDLIATLIIWSTKKTQSSFIDAHGKEALNFLISFYIYAVFLVVLSCFYNWHSLPDRAGHL